MSSSHPVLTSRWAANSRAPRRFWQIIPLALIHLAALIVMVRIEYHEFPYIAAYLLFWGLLNFAWIAILRRPAAAAALSLTIVVVLILVSQYKYRVLWMTADFVDLLIINPAALRYLFTIFPGLGVHVLITAAVVVPILALLWLFDPFRMSRRHAFAGFGVSLSGLVGLSLLFPFDPHDGFYPDKHVSHFARSGVDAVGQYFSRGLLESDAFTPDRLGTAAEATCEPAAKPPHIILVHDESAFDIRTAPNVIAPPGYGRHFRSLDGVHRKFVVETAGGSSWYTEYNVLTGLSARSFGRFSYFVTRIAVGRVTRGLPSVLRRCGYRTFSLYPAYGAFMSARKFQSTAGVQRFYDSNALRANDIEPDDYYYDTAARMFARERAGGPMFMFIYLSANHHPWDYGWRHELTLGWKNPGNTQLVDEYLRRQTLGMRHYQEFLERLKRDFPGESFLLIRYGDHQPDFAPAILEPSLKPTEVAQRIMVNHPKYFTTYYAIDTVNYKPATMASAIDNVEAPYLPLILLEAAGLPLDSTFAEQKKIFGRCRGLFYTCAGGAEARRFNRMLIDAGWIKGL
ncbi:MAG: sulfatase-like hydrolase/transferase [Xanthobacteraceae bacterium]